MLRRIVLALIAVPALYGLMAVALPLVPVPGEPPAGEGVPGEVVEVFVCSNGVHTDLVMPASTEAMDWSGLLLRSDFPLADPAATHVAFGWGDRDFYLQTRSWDDLSLRTAWLALFGGGPSVVHVYYLASPAGIADCGRLLLAEGQYRRLVTFVRDSFAAPVRPLLGATYSGDDRFYPAVGTYSPFVTCNQWTARALKAAGVAMGLWTPLADGVMRWVR